jgi:hypothetical protein
MLLPSESRGRPRSAEPLTESEHAAAEQVSRRLHAELRGVVSLMALPERGASAMARTLMVDRATCQRIVGAIARPDASPETLVQLPGVEGLRQFVAAVAHRVNDPVARERLTATTAAIDRFETLLTELGRSQRRLKERLDAGKGFAATQALVPHAGADSERTREALFHAGAGLTGRWSAATISVSVIRPLADATKTESARVLGLIGHQWRDECVPLEVGQTATLRSVEEGSLFANLDGEPLAGAAVGTLIPEFSASPAPRCTPRAIGPRVVQMIDTAEHAAQPIDIVTAVRTAVPDRHPATMQPAVGEVWSLQHIAARRLVFDTFLHRDIARRCIPSLEVHLWRPDVSRHAAARWSTRLPGGPRLEVLGQGLAATGTPAYARHRDLLDHVFTRTGWDPDEFVGYRCEVAYPAWRAGYCMLFDFTGNEIG